MRANQVPNFDTIESPPYRSDIEYEMVKGGELIGSGGQAIVKRASIPGPEPPDTVAVKQPQAPSETLDTEVIEAFFEEAETWAKLAERERTDQHRNSDHIVGIVAVGDEGLPWLAMEYMNGGSLRDRLDELQNGLPVDEALWIAKCLCEGIKLAHDNGVAHLDLKPQNILFRKTSDDTWDVPKIADWGLARSLLADSQSMEMLSIEYAAPEQFDKDEFGKPDTYTDIYQIGVIIYEMLTGEPPYTGGHMSVMNSVCEDEPEPLSNHREQIPDVLDDIVLKTLSTEKPERYQGSIDRLGEKIQKVLKSLTESTSQSTTQKAKPNQSNKKTKSQFRSTTQKAKPNQSNKKAESSESSIQKAKAKQPNNKNIEFAGTVNIKEESAIWLANQSGVLKVRANTDLTCGDEVRVKGYGNKDVVIPREITKI